MKCSVNKKYFFDQNTPQGSYNCGRCPDGYIGDSSTGCLPAEGYCRNGQRCDRNAECEDHGYGEYSCECLTGWAGNGVICGPDSDLDKYPDTQLPCNERHCKQVSVLLPHISAHIKFVLV